jgi:hypothetical protein
MLTYYASSESVVKVAEKKDWSLSHSLEPFILKDMSLKITLTFETTDIGRYK